MLCPPVIRRPLALRLGALLGLLLMQGCGSSEQGPEQPTTWAVLEEAFGPALFDDAARQRLFAPHAYDRLALPALVDASRYRWLYVADLYRLGPNLRTAEVAYAIDDWPMALRVQIARDADTGLWTIQDVEDPEVQRARLELLAEGGLPRAPSARPWRGGLSARDAVGRPTATVLILAWRDTVEVDGIILNKPRHGAVVKAVEDALRIRTRLAADAHATYTPQVAIAIEARAPAGRLAELVSAAEAAGVEEYLLVVRGPDGSPALMPLAREADAARTLPPVARVDETEEGVQITLGALVETVPRKGTGVDRDALRATLDKMTSATPELAGLVITLWSKGDHGYTVRLLDALRAAAPQLGLVVRAP